MGQRMVSVSQLLVSSVPWVRPRVNPRLEAGTLTKKWHMAYHGSNVAAVRRVLDRGELGAGIRGPAEAGRAGPRSPGMFLTWLPYRHRLHPELPALERRARGRV